MATTDQLFLPLDDVSSDDGDDPFRGGEVVSVAEAVLRPVVLVTLDVVVVADAVKVARNPPAQ